MFNSLKMLLHTFSFFFRVICLTYFSLPIELFLALFIILQGNHRRDVSNHNYIHEDHTTMLPVFLFYLKDKIYFFSNIKASEKFGEQQRNIRRVFIIKNQADTVQNFILLSSLPTRNTPSFLRQNDKSFMLLLVVLLYTILYFKLAYILFIFSVAFSTFFRRKE